MLLRSLAACTVAALVLVTDSRSQTSTEDRAVQRAFEKTLAQVRSQRELLRQASFRYTARFLFEDGRSTDHHNDGWWARDDGRVASYRRSGSDPEITAQEAWRWSVWNGVATRSVASSEAMGPDGAPRSELVRTHGTPNDEALSYLLGGPLGLYYWHQPWADVIDPEYADVRPVGFEVVDGERCLGVLFDHDPLKAGKDASYQVPVIAWFQTEGGCCVRRIAEFIREDVALKWPAPITPAMRRYADVPELAGRVIGSEILLDRLAAIPSTRCVVAHRASLLRHQAIGRIPAVETVVTDVSIGAVQLPLDPFRLPLRFPVDVFGTKVRFQAQDEGELRAHDLNAMAARLAPAFGQQPPSPGRRITGTPVPSSLDLIALLASAIDVPEFDRDLALFASVGQPDPSAAEIAAALTQLDLLDLHEPELDVATFLKRERPALLTLAGTRGQSTLALAIPRATGDVDIVRPLVSVETIRKDQLAGRFAGDAFYLP